MLVCVCSSCAFPAASRMPDSDDMPLHFPHIQVPSLPPTTTGPPAPAGTLTLEATLTPNPAVAGGDVTASGQAVWSTGIPPQGTAQILVCAHPSKAPCGACMLGCCASISVLMSTCMVQVCRAKRFIAIKPLLASDRHAPCSES